MKTAFTIPEAADILKVGIHTLRRYIKSLEISPSLDPHNHRRILLSHDQMSLLAEALWHAPVEELSAPEQMQLLREQVSELTRRVTALESRSWVWPVETPFGSGSITSPTQPPGSAIIW